MVIEAPINLPCPVYINKYGANEGLFAVKGI